MNRAAASTKICVNYFFAFVLIQYSLQNPPISEASKPCQGGDGGCDTSVSSCYEELNGSQRCYCKAGFIGGGSTCAESTFQGGMLRVSTDWETVTLHPPVPNAVVLVGRSPDVRQYVSAELNKVRSDQFEVRLKSGECGHLIAPKSVRVSWAAIPAGEFITTNISIKVKASIKKLFPPFEELISFNDYFDDDKIVVIPQMQDVSLKDGHQFDHSVSVTSVSRSGFVVKILGDTSSLTEVTLGYVAIEDKSDCLSHRCKLSAQSDNVAAYTATGRLVHGKYLEPQLSPYILQALTNPLVFVSPMRLINQVSVQLNTSATGSLNGSLVGYEYPDSTCTTNKVSTDLELQLLIFDFVSVLGASPIDNRPLDAASGREKCSIVNMFNKEPRWNATIASCTCPDGSPPCDLGSIESDRSIWMKQINAICHNQTLVAFPVALGYKTFDTSIQNICKDPMRSQIKWKSLALPIDGDSQDAADTKSGAHHCTFLTPLVFCKGQNTDDFGSGVSGNAHETRKNCVVSEWSKWSPCGEICVGPGQAGQVKRRSRIIIIDETKEGTCEQRPSLTEQKPCGNLPLCDEMNSMSEWGDWTKCSNRSTTISGEKKAVQVRHRSVYALNSPPKGWMRPSEIGKSHLFREFRPCLGSSAVNSSTEIPAASMISLSNTVNQACSYLSEWSGCEEPCLRTKKLLRYKIGFSSLSGYDCAVEVNTKVRSMCPTTIRKCEEDKFTCEGVSALYIDEETTKRCRSDCIAAKDACGNATQFETCFMKQMKERFFDFRELCNLESLLVGKSQNVCFPSLTTHRRDLSSPKLWLNENQEYGDACICQDADAVPCTAEEVANSRMHWERMVAASVCPNKRGAIFIDGDPGTSSGGHSVADSSSYFALAHRERMHCPLPAYKDKNIFTYTRFDSTSDMENFCRYGSLMMVTRGPYKFDRFDLNCHATKSLLETSISTAECKKACESLQSTCKNSTATSQCLSAAKNVLVNGGVEVKFCDLPEVPRFGKGLMFCKYVSTHCRFSDWTEWSPCSASCKEMDILPTRSRSKKVIQPARFEGKPCGSVNSETVTEAEECHHLPECGSIWNAEASTNKSVLHSEGMKNKTEAVPTDKSLPIAVATIQQKSSLSDTQSNLTAAEGVACEVLYTGDLAETLTYNSERNECNCLPGRKLCSAAEVLQHESVWLPSIEDICRENPHAVILAQKFSQYSCANKMFLPYRKAPDSLSENKGCERSDIYLFCQVPMSEVSWYTSTWIYYFLSAALGVMSGILVAFFIVQYSSDFRALLGLKDWQLELESTVGTEREKDT